jgi:hypothetical protein
MLRATPLHVKLDESSERPIATQRRTVFTHSLLRGRAERRLDRKLRPLMMTSLPACWEMTSSSGMGQNKYHADPRRTTTTPLHVKLDESSEAPIATHRRTFDRNTTPLVAQLPRRST